MWHEARKQEKYIRNVMVDVKKRAERRKDFYEKIKQDPIRFLRLYGTKAKVNIDPEIAAAAEHPNTLMVWTGDNETVIDRFDVRANLDSVSNRSHYSPDTDEKLHERMCNYERYRCLVHNQNSKISEASALSKIDVTEKFGEDIHKIDKIQSKKRQTEKAAIGYVYSDSDYVHQPSDSDKDSDSQDSDPDLEMDLDIELDIAHLSVSQQKELLKISQLYGMRGNDYMKLMKIDKMQEEEFRTAKLLEEQKAQFHGRKSRRERKIFKEQRLRERYMKQDPRTLSFGASTFHEELYAGMNLLTPSPERDSKSRSNSPSDRTNAKNTGNSLNDFINLPTVRDFSDSRSRSRSLSRSRGKRRSSSPIYGPRLPTSSLKSSSSSSHKRSSYRDKLDSREKRRKFSCRHSRSPDRYSKIKKEPTRSRDKFSHHHNSAQSKSPEIPEEEILKKKYYKSDPEDDSSESDDSSDCQSRKNDKYDRKEFSQISEKEMKSSNYQKTDKISAKFNPQEFLKKQMELQLNKAYRADKKAEQEKQQKAEKERMDRESQLKEMALQIRKREREKRLKERRDSSRSYSSSSSKSSSGRRRSDSRDRSSRHYRRRSGSRCKRSRSKDNSRRYFR